MNSQATMIENYINKGRDVLWVTADTVNYMIENNLSNEDIHHYLEQETAKVEEEVDENFTGIYGYINGEIDAKDRYTSGHSQRVAEYALAIAERMGKSEEDRKIIYLRLQELSGLQMPMMQWQATAVTGMP